MRSSPLLLSDIFTLGSVVTSPVSNPVWAAERSPTGWDQSIPGPTVPCLERSCYHHWQGHLEAAPDLLHGHLEAAPNLLHGHLEAALHLLHGQNCQGCSDFKFQAESSLTDELLVAEFWLRGERNLICYWTGAPQSVLSYVCSFIGTNTVPSPHC